ncbi:MAG: hypothetical protein AB1424_14650 [Thermodesulfobacteriota bacterium]
MKNTITATAPGGIKDTVAARPQPTPGDLNPVRVRWDRLDLNPALVMWVRRRDKSLVPARLVMGRGKLLPRLDLNPALVM